MKIPDVNVLLYAEDEVATHHDRARAWLESSLSEAEPTGFAWATLIGFLRIATSAAVYPQPLTAEEALGGIDEWLEHPGTCIVGPGAEHRRVLRQLIEESGTAGNLTSDAHLAAITIEVGATLASFDADFHRFDRLRFEFLG